jgi:hypothetical protein
MFRNPKLKNEDFGMNQNGVQRMLYLHDEEAYEQLMEDYDDKVWNESLINKSNNISSPHTLLNPSYYEDKKDLRKVRTPIEPIEELKSNYKETLRASGSYSIESLRNYKNDPLLFTKIEQTGRLAHNTNHLKLKVGRYMHKPSKAADNI